MRSGQSMTFKNTEELRSELIRVFTKSREDRGAPVDPSEIASVVAQVIETSAMIHGCAIEDLHKHHGSALAPHP